MSASGSDCPACVKRKPGLPYEGRRRLETPSGVSTRNHQLNPRKTKTRNDVPGADMLPKSKTREMDRVLPDMLRCWSGGGTVTVRYWSGGGMGAVWGRSDVSFSKL
jgi:hypothetical protein